MTTNVTRALPAFTKNESAAVYRLLATRVAGMFGRKLEEADWTDVYCEAKGLKKQGWSNLGIDIVQDGLGVEQKMLRQSSGSPITSVCGTTLMHPSATRSIRVQTNVEAQLAMKDVLTQYGALIEQRRSEVSRQCPSREPDMRLGWLLWREDLVEFLYFEERMVSPDPAKYRAEWKERGATGGRRKPSRSLWIYHIETGKKRFSVTTDAGAKIQPYFDVPATDDPNLYYFRTQGIPLDGGLVQLWLSPATATELAKLVGPLTPTVLSAAIIDTAEHQGALDPPADDVGASAVPVMITAEAYGTLCSSFRGISDEDRALHLKSALQRAKR